MSQPTFLRPHPPNLLRVTESQAFSSSSSLVSSAPSSVFDRISRATSGYLTDATPPITPSTSGVVQDGIKGDIGSLRLPETPLKQQLLPDRLRHAGNVHGHKSGSTPRLRSLIASGEDLGYASDKEDSPHDAVAILRSRLARGKSTLAARRALRIMAARSSACPANDSQSPLSAGSDTSVHKMTVMVTQPKSPVDEWSSDLELQATKAPMHGEPTEDNSIAVNGGLQATTESQTPENDLADNFPSPQVPEETPPSDENVVKKFGVDKSLDDDNWSLETELDSAEILQICFGTPEAITPETRDVVDEFLPYDLEGLSIGSYEMFSGNTLALLKDTIPGSPQIEKGSSVLDFLPAPVPYVMPCKPRLRGIPLDDAACSPLALSSSPSWKLNWTSSPVVYSPLVLNPAKMPILGDVLGLVGQMTSPTRPPFRWVMGRPFVEKDLLGAVSLNSPDHASKFSSSDNHTPGISRAPRTPIGLGFAMPLTYPPLPLTLFPNQPHPDSNSSPLDAEDQMIESQILEIEQTFSGVLSKKDLQSPRNLSSKEHSGKDHEHVIEIPIQHTSSPKLANAHNFEDNVELENAVLANSSLYHPTPARPGQFFVGLDLEGSKRMTMALSPLPRPSRHPIQDLENGAIHQGYQKLLSHVVVPSQQIDIEKLTTESEIEPSGVLSESEVECELLDHSQKSSVLITNKDCIEMSSSLSKTGLGIEGLTIAVPCRALRREEIGSLSTQTRLGAQITSANSQLDFQPLHSSTPRLRSPAPVAADLLVPNHNNSRSGEIEQTSRGVLSTNIDYSTVPVIQASTKRTKALARGLGLPSHLASRTSTACNTSPEGTDPIHRRVSIHSRNAQAGEFISLAAPTTSVSPGNYNDPSSPPSPTATRGTKEPRNFLKLAKFAKRSLYAIRELPTPSPTFSPFRRTSSPRNNLLSPGWSSKFAVIGRFNSPKKKTSPQFQSCNLKESQSPSRPHTDKSTEGYVRCPSSAPIQGSPLARSPGATRENPPGGNRFSKVANLFDFSRRSPPGPELGNDVVSSPPVVEHLNAPRGLRIFRRDPDSRKTGGARSLTAAANKLQLLF